jgi:subtilisin family serine protease/fibronectin type 3 domain-containing protein
VDRVFRGLTRGLAATVALLLAAAGAGSREPAEAAPRGRGDDDALIVAFKPTAPTVARFAALDRESLDLDDADSRHFVRVRVGERAKRRGHSRKSALAALRAHPAVRFAEPDLPVRALGIPNDTSFGSLWGLHNVAQSGGVPDADIDAPEAWDVTTGSANVVVAVIDTGVDYNHPDLTDNILRDQQGNVVGYDFYNNDALPMDDNGHGTHCAGTIGARGNNGIGVAGVAHNVKIMPVKFLSAAGSGSTSGAIKALDFATENGAKVMSNSWGGAGASQALNECLGRAKAAGAVVVCAAGNESTDNDSTATYPANYNQAHNNMLSVASTDVADNLSGFSNYGVDTVDLAAPGSGIYSTYPTTMGSYRTLSGTSMATPHVAGAAALLLAHYPQITYSALITRLLGAVDHPVALAGKVRTGRLNVAKALITDENPPGAPTDLAVSHRASDGFLATWKASGDDGAVGVADLFELRYSTSPITPGNWASATPATGLPFPGVSGTSHSFLLMGLSPGAAYHLAIRAVDKVGNVSPLTTFGPLATLATSPLVTSLSDDAEGLAQFSGDSPWARTTEAASSPTRSYSDSPGGPYLDNVEASLSQDTPVSLSGYTPTLQFRSRHDLEEGYDFLFVEVTADQGDTWEQLVALTGTNLSWQTRTLGLGRYYGRTIQIRFRLSSDFIVEGDGVWLDDIKISGNQLVPLSGPTVPNAPGSFAASAPNQTTVNLSWTDASGDETGFRLERKKTTDLSYTLLATLNPNVVGHSDTTAQAGTGYNYRLTAFNGVGDSPTVFTSVTTPPNAPPAPTGLTATPADSEVTLFWNAAPGAVSYTIRRGAAPGGPYSDLKTGHAVTTYVDSTAVNGTTYYYVVVAVNTGGASGPSNEAFAAPVVLPPQPPTGVAARRTDFKKAKLEWVQSVSPNVTKNRIYRATSQLGPWAQIAEIPAATQYVNSGLNKKLSYYYQVTAVNAAGLESAKSNFVFVAVKKKKN